MKRRAWPWQGDSPVTRARKVALAYRNVAQEQHQRNNDLVDLLRKIDPRILGWVQEDIRREIADLLKFTHASPVRELDARFYDWGENWHAEGYTRAFDDDEWITAEEAAQLLLVTNGAISRLRIAGRLHGEYIEEKGQQSRWYYKARDIYALQWEKRTRTSQNEESTVSMHDSGSSDVK